MVYDGEDRIYVAIGWQSDDEVHRGGLEWKSLHVGGDFVHGYTCFVSEDLPLLTRCTSSNVVFNPEPHVGPPKEAFGLP